MTSCNCPRCNDHAATLGLKLPVSYDEIAAAYKDLVKVWHPDRFENDPRLRKKAEETFKLVQQAFSGLKEHGFDNRAQHAAPESDAQQSDSSKNCRVCGKLMRAHFEICPSCGCNQASTPSSTTPPTSSITPINNPMMPRILFLVGLNFLWNGLGNIVVGDKRGWKYGFLNWVFFIASIWMAGVPSILFFAYCGFLGYEYIRDSEGKIESSAAEVPRSAVAPSEQKSDVKRNWMPDIIISVGSIVALLGLYLCLFPQQHLSPKQPPSIPVEHSSPPITFTAPPLSPETAGSTLPQSQPVPIPSGTPKAETRSYATNGQIINSNVTDDSEKRRIEAEQKAATEKVEADHRQSAALAAVASAAYQYRLSADRSKATTSAMLAAPPSTTRPNDGGRSEYQARLQQLQTLEAETWRTVQSSGNPYLFETYLRMYPSGAHSGEAQQKMQLLRQADSREAQKRLARGELFIPEFGIAVRGLSPEQVIQLQKRKSLLARVWNDQGWIGALEVTAVDRARLPYGFRVEVGDIILSLGQLRRERSRVDPNALTVVRDLADRAASLGLPQDSRGPTVHYASMSARTGQIVIEGFVWCSRMWVFRN